jgi:hypothetical protein
MSFRRLGLGCIDSVTGRVIWLLSAAFGTLVGCAGPDGSSTEVRMAEAPTTDGRLFTQLPSAYTGVRFENRLADTRELNVFTYRNYYNGGGVALGDLTGDGLPEILLTANLGENHLYLNEGAFRFRDVTAEAGVAGKGFWATGVTFVDVNGDGLLDVYVCYAGDVAERRSNELYINQGLNGNGVPTFTEMASAFGIADEGWATHAAFFDYDRDGYLDLYLLNNSSRAVNSFGLQNIRHVRHDLGGDKLYRNVGGRFVDVSDEAGILGSEIAFGLGVGVGDLNRDGWLDIYVSNDFFERDYLYINQRDGTFAELLDQQMPYISYSSMGLDIADIDNDAWPDVYVLDMLPEDDRRLKMTFYYESWDVYQIRLDLDYHHQFVRNMLHRNNGNGTYSEIGQMAGVSRTDWSWGAVIADYDLDGYKDIHVTTGIARDVTEQDYVEYLGRRETMQSIAAEGKQVDFMRLVDMMSETPLPNYGFRNNGDLTFSNPGAAWALDTKSFSNGAAYGDLDGDGALDLVVNNVNQEAFIYRNNARTVLDNHYLQIELEGEAPNRFAVGAGVTLRSGDHLFFQELIPSRGFQSSVDYVMTFGIGGLDTIELVTVEWPLGGVSRLKDVVANQRLTVRKSASTLVDPVKLETPAPFFMDVSDEVELDFVHQENEFVDFQREPLMPKMLSTEGPFMAVSDVNGDGLDDAFIGGAKDQPGALLLQKPDGGFARSNGTVFERDRVSEDLGAAFFDADGNGSVDLYVVSGGSEFSDMAPALRDRLYLNDGKGNFRKATGHLPAIYTSGSRVAPHDFDDDGDIDLFVGGRVVPWRYGLDPPSVLLENDGQGNFSDATQRLAPKLERTGMVTDALWQDIDGDGRIDLVVVGEWMPITVYRKTASGEFARMDIPGVEMSHGWWNRVVAGDFTGDGLTDFVVGNLGLNTGLWATENEPTTMYVRDFDRNGVLEQIVSRYSNGISYPLALRDDLIRSIPFLKSRYPTYEAYAGQTVTDIFTPEQLADAGLKKAYTFATSLVRNNGDGSFTLVPLPPEAQIAPVYGILAGDFDEDEDQDLLLAGNFSNVKPEIGRMTASYGLFLCGDGKGTFVPVPTRESGFRVPGQARDIQRVRTNRGELYVVTRNNDRTLVFRSAQSARISTTEACH